MVKLALVLYSSSMPVLILLLHLIVFDPWYCILVVHGRRKTLVHCVQKKTPTHIFFYISMNDVWI